jgi:hypothetical protein
MKPERFELPDVTTHRPFRVSTREIVGPKLVVGDSIPHDVERDFENLVADITAFLCPRCRFTR